MNTHPGMNAENSETNGKHNNLLREKHMSFILNSSNIGPPIGFPWRLIFSFSKKPDLTSSETQSLSTHVRIKQGMDSSIGDSVGFFNSEFRE